MPLVAPPEGPGQPPASDSSIDQIEFGGKFVARFDGEVLEIFGPLGQFREDWRFHRALMRIYIEEPDKKGIVKLEIYPVGGADTRWRGQPCTLKIPEQLSSVIEFFERVRATLPAS